MAGDYDNPWPVKDVKGDTKRSLSAYARGINHSDRALKDFLTKLSASKEKTAVVFYGDHLPGIYPQDMYDENGDVTMKSTPFFIWTNFTSEKVPTATLTSPIYFLPLLFAQMDAKVPAYYALLTEMYQSIPAMEQGVRFNWAGDPLVEDTVDEQLLHDYRLVQYDLSVGNRYAQSMFY
jgi:phosphoglycerol transferase MdoB-like AlkP superfamily enzyme